MPIFQELRPRESRDKLLSQVSLLSELSRRELRVVNGFIHQREYLANEIVFDHGEDGEALYFVISGEVQINRQGELEAPFARLGAGAFFGELALIDGSPRSAQAVAMAPTHLALLFRGDFERLMQSHAQISTKIAMQLARHLGQRLRNMLAASVPACGQAK